MVAGKIKITSRVNARNMDAAAEDVRRERTRNLLAGAVISFASEHDISSASIAELARKAGIYRTTFYSHAETPTGLLVKVLLGELDIVRQEGIAALGKDGQLLRPLSHHLLEEVVNHVLKYEAIYAGADQASSSFALRTVLAEHIETSISLYIHSGYLKPPSTRSEDISVYSGFISHGLAGAVEAWLRFAAPRNREQLLTAIESVLPAWYAPEPVTKPRGTKRVANGKTQKSKRRTA